MAKESGVTAADFEPTSTTFNRTPSFVAKKMRDWTRYDFKNDNLWEAFLDNFEDYIVKKFKLADIDELRELRSFPRRRGVWVQMKSKISAVNSLMNLLKEEKSTEWTGEEIRRCWRQDKFISEEVLNFMT